MTERRRVWAILAIAILAFACSPAVAEKTPLAAIDSSTGHTSSPSATALATAPPPILYPPRDASATYPVIRTWAEVLESHPYPYLKPLPPPTASEIDGVYGKFDPSEPQWWRCARCADFKLAGGNWRLMLHQGEMRMYYEVTGFSTLASYAAQDSRLELFNDPHCPYEVGEYTWSIEEGALRLVEVQDTCAIHLRAENLVHQPWISCQPPNPEAGVTDHWMRPPGCG